MSWNYRILAFKPDISEMPARLAERLKDEIDFQICEVYYDKKDKAINYSIGQKVHGDDVKSLRWSLNKMKESLKKPILWGGKQFPKEYKL